MPGSARGIRAGNAFIELSLFDNQFARGLAAAQSKLSRFGNSIRGFGLQLGAIGTGIAAPLGLAAKQYADFGSQIYDLSKRTGFSTEALSTLGYAAEQSGSSIQGLEAGIRRMHAVLADAKNSGGAAAKTLERLGLSAGQLSTLAPEKRFDRILEALAGISDEGDRAALAMDVFGKSGANLLPMLDGGFQAFQNLRGELQQMGGELSRLDALQADQLGDSIGKLTRSFAVIRNEVGQALAPALTKIAGTLTDSAGSAARFVERNRELVVAIGATGMALNALSGTMLSLSVVVNTVSASFGLLASMVGTLGIAGTGIAAAIIAATAATVDWQKQVDILVGSLEAIMAALGGGRLELAINIGAKAFHLAWTEAFNNVQQRFESMLNTLSGNNLRQGAMNWVMAGMIGGNWSQIKVAKKWLDEFTSQSGAVSAGKAHAATLRRELDAMKQMAMDVVRETEAAADQAEPKQAQEKVSNAFTSALLNWANDFSGLMSKVSGNVFGGMREGLAQLAETTKDYLSLLQEGRDVWEQTRTPVERYESQIQRLKQLLESRVITPDTFNRAVDQARENMRNAIEADADMSKISGTTLFGANRAAQVFAIETFQRQTIALEKQQVQLLENIDRNTKKQIGLAFK